MSKALYRKYRSKSLDEIVGQEHITAILKRAIEQNKIAHAYLLTGPRGVGKTSIARILAHAINNLPYTEESQHLDIIEIDAASNNSVEDVRDLREKVQIAPVSAKRKVYIIDEVHMLSKQAFNALLKTLEEPPEHIVFILATTDADKLPATIISRVQRFNFRAISEQDVVKHLAAIAKEEKIAINNDALQLIATHGKGSFRDSIGLLDQMQHVSDGTITRDMVAQILGLADQEIIRDLLNAHTTGNLQKTVELLNNAAANGAPAHVIAEQLIATIRQNIIAEPHLLPLLDDLLNVTKSAWPEVKLLTALANHAPRRSELDSDHVGLLGQLESWKVRKSGNNMASEARENSTRSALKAVGENVDQTGAESDRMKSNDTSGTVGHSSSKSPTTSFGASSETRDSEEVMAGQARETATLRDEDSLAPAANDASDSNPTAFNWIAFSEAVKPKAAGAFALLKSCGHDYDGKILTIYAGKKFNKNKLDKAMPDLSAALTELGMLAEIIITDAAKPPADATTAAILDMMGGGEEIRAAE